MAIDGTAIRSAGVRRHDAFLFRENRSAGYGGCVRPFNRESVARYQSAGLTVGAIPCRIVKRSPGGVAAAEFMVAREKLQALWEILLDVTRKHDGGPMGYLALSGLRLAQGVPWFGYDFGEKQIPHEAGLQDSHISYTKGCYTGQEIVERVRSRGQVNRQRVRLSFSGEAVPEAGTQMMMEGREFGFVTRAARVWDSAPPRILGMGYVRKEGNAPGTTLHWAEGAATVENLK